MEEKTTNLYASMGEELVHYQVDYQPGLGSRHLDVHPVKPWVYVSVERGNSLCVHTIDRAGTVPPGSLFTRRTLADKTNGTRARQLAGPIHIHPHGTHVYVANRCDEITKDGETDVLPLGENNIAVFRLDGESAEPSVIQHADTRGSSPRAVAVR